MLTCLGINKGSQVYLHLLRELGQDDNGNRQVAFYHRNTSEKRKQEILADLQLPFNSADKKMTCVVATVSLGRLGELSRGGATIKKTGKSLLWGGGSTRGYDV